MDTFLAISYSLLNNVDTNFFNLSGFKPIIISYFILVLLLSLEMLRSCYKWTSRKVSSISIVADNFEIEVIEKDDVKTYRIPIQNFNITKKCSWGRPRVLTLTLLNLQSKIVNLYAATTKDRSDLDYLKYTIDKQIG